MITQISVVALWASDVPACAQFYREVVGLYQVPSHGNIPHFRIGGTYLVLMQGQPTPAQNATPERFPLLALATDDLDGALARLKARQVELPWGVEADANARWVMFHDPGGNLVELVQSASGRL
jgi:catechol-2,3-dioxygenase